MKIIRFEDIVAWQKAQDLAVDIHRVMNHHNDYDFKRQILRATISISNNIAEGFDRSSNLDFKRFLYISLASNSEVRSMLYLAYRLEYISENDRDALIQQTIEISKILNGFIASLK